MMVIPAAISVCVSISISISISVSMIVIPPKVIRGRCRCFCYQGGSRYGAYPYEILRELSKLVTGFPLAGI